MKDEFELALGFAAQGWCHELTKHKEMDSVIAEGVARMVIQPLLHSIEAAWGIIAAANHGDWQGADPEWREAAERWRDNHWHKILSGRVPVTPQFSVEKSE